MNDYTVTLMSRRLGPLLFARVVAWDRSHAKEIFCERFAAIGTCDGDWLRVDEVADEAVIVEGMA